MTKIYGSVRLEKKKLLFKKCLLTYLCTVRIIPDVFILDNTLLARKVEREKSNAILVRHVTYVATYCA